MKQGWGFILCQNKHSNNNNKKRKEKKKPLNTYGLGCGIQATGLRQTEHWKSTGPSEMLLTWDQCSRGQQEAAAAQDFPLKLHFPSKKRWK